MDDSTKVVGWTWMLVSLAILIWSLVVGGQWRTDVSFSNAEPSSTKGFSNYHQTFGASHWLGGLIQGKQVDISHELAANKSGGLKVLAVKIQTKHSVPDLLLTGVTLGIYSPCTVTVDATMAQ